MSVEVAKKNGGKFLPKWRGKLRFAYSSSGDISVGGKAKFMAGEGLELHAGPNVNLAKGSVNFEVAVQTELDPIVKEQEGAFPTILTWSLAVEYPDELTIGIKISRGGFTFHFPIELPVVDTKWALIGALAAWTFAPLVTKSVKQLVMRLATGKKALSEGTEPVNATAEQGDGAAERKALESEANDRRNKEVSIGGLVILDAKYAEIDVSHVLMARVRDSQLSLSANTKSTLVGIRHPTPGHDLFITYKYGSTIFARVFKDTDIVLLP
jgi:hypothetical protein